jgi:putative FmdB family regulatory protein
VPTYEYCCAACGFCFEQFQSITSRPLRKCPQCGRMQLNRLIGTGAGILFKGNGFYETDYRSEGYKQAQKKEGAGTASGSDKVAEKGAAKEVSKKAATSDSSGTPSGGSTESSGGAKPKKS